MKFIIITHVIHIEQANEFFGYAPYVREMNVWLKYVDQAIIVAPLQKGIPTTIDIAYSHKKMLFKEIPSFNSTNFYNVAALVYKLPIIFWTIYCAMKKADHIHLRCPGNVGLIGCFVQILFPNKRKTAKYAGNWDPKSKQPLSYRLQKWILNNTFLTRNMKVLVYGEWEKASSNVKPFFTASYFEKEKFLLKELDLNGINNFIFVGTLSSGKNPLYAIQLVENLHKRGYQVSLNLYGEGRERKTLENYIALAGLERFIALKGNQNQKIITEAYQNSHFVILASKSEGWPKALAEGMFWGCIPIATAISCIPFMLDYGKRGILLNKGLDNDTKQLESIINDPDSFNAKRKKASEWSRNYTFDTFESEIKKMM
ncbi:glycosyltransferase [Flavobacterium sp. ACN6]|uniref:glycosyltransferase n=1 Tax=Flavobacterium sp. ACN6 TaxID=1920426 RepID=UPI000BB3BBDB|nr:glycosyltransferase [Flavobacterium sp. ACN6]PBJ13831.1 UDP-D-galactose:(glucosyl)lipopolysaccharide-1,6-D-galactosyltransferase [Flavobacterium sp. ACN6]